MNIIETVNSDGFKERWAIMSEDDEADAAEVGIYVGVPDLSSIDWKGLHREIHNALHDQGIFTHEDIQARNGMVTSVVKVALTRQIIRLYTE